MPSFSSQSQSTSHSNQNACHTTVSF